MSEPSGNAHRQQSKNFFEDVNFQDRLCKLMIYDEATLQTCAILLEPNDFKPRPGLRNGRPRWIIADCALRYYEKHHEPVGKLIRTEMLAFAKQTGLSERQVQECEDYLQHLKTVPDSATEAIVEKVLRYKEERRQAEALEELSALQGLGQLTEEKWYEISEKTYTGLPTTTAPKSGMELLTTDYPEPRYALNAKLSVGLGLFSARPKIGKTWLALRLTLSMVLNRPFLGSQVKTPGAALYIALEDTDRGIRDRIRLMMPGVSPEDLADLQIVHECAGVAGLRSLLSQRPYALVVIDPLLAFMGQRRTRDDIVRADYHELHLLQKLAQEFQTTILVVAHNRKAAGDMRDVVLGTTGVTAAVDTLWVMTRDPESDKTCRLQVTGRDVREHTLKITFGRLKGGGYGWGLIAQGPEADAGPVGRQILALLKEKGPMSAKEVAKALGKPETNMYENLHRLVKRRLAIHAGGGKYAYPA